MADEQILEKLVALNAERAAEEQRGLIRWLRPEFQNKGMTQPALDLPETAANKAKGQKPTKAKKQDWPTSMADQAKALRTLLASGGPARTAEEIAATFRRANAERVAELLETLASLGQARKVDAELYSA